MTAWPDPESGLPLTLRCSCSPFITPQKIMVAVCAAADQALCRTRFWGAGGSSCGCDMVGTVRRQLLFRQHHRDLDTATQRLAGEVGLCLAQGRLGELVVVAAVRAAWQ